MKGLVLVIISLLVVSHVFTQDLAFYCDAMVNLDDDRHRKIAGKSFNRLMDEDLQTADSFNEPYDQLKWVSILYPADSSFRTITWQLKLNDNEYEYYGYIQTSNGSLKKIDTEWGDEGIDEDQAIAWDKWSGGLVYNIISTKKGYTLFTFRYLDEFTKVKTCESLSFETDNIMLGHTPKFEKGEDIGQYKSRLTLEFSSDSNGTLNYDADTKRIVYDNLIPVMGRLPGQGPTQVPDGSYKGFEYKGDKWQSIDKLFDQISEQAPRRATTKSGKDLFGRSGG